MRTDEQLMCAYADGDRSAFDELFRRYSAVVQGFMRRDLWSPEDARDLTQQAFLQLHRSRHDFRGDGNLRSWLMTIARNLKFDYMRQVRRRPPAATIEDPESGPEVADESQRRLLARDALEHAIARLPENQQDVIRLYWFEHLPYAEIARKLDASESAVKVRAHRAYKALREILEDESNFGSDSSILRST
ncbi:MAG: RNA polymerase sigma factor [Planctomycetota bacterium]|jgi:RNA polymerase sigma-70 factor (ECF subfamily)